MGLPKVADTSMTLATLRLKAGLFFVHEINQHRRIGQTRIFFVSRLHQMAVEAILVPGEIRLARKVRRNPGAAAVNFAFLQSQVDLDTTRIAAHFLEFYSHGFFQDVVHDGGQIRSSGGAAFGRFLRIHNIFDGFPRRVGSHVKQQVPLVDTADPR
jgi:hypothetical protein